MANLKGKLWFFKKATNAFWLGLALRLLLAGTVVAVIALAVVSVVQIVLELADSGSVQPIA